MRDRAVRTQAKGPSCSLLGPTPLHVELLLALRSCVPSSRLFGFTTPLGTEYRGKWNDTSTFVIVVDDASGAGPIELGQTRVHASVRYDAVRLRNRAGCGGADEPSCLMPYVPPPPQLAGDFGRLPEPPRLLGASIEDYDNADSVYSANDTITVRFDRPTNYAGGPRDGGRSFVDAVRVNTRRAAIF